MHTYVHTEYLEEMAIPFAHLNSVEVPVYFIAFIAKEYSGENVRPIFKESILLLIWSIILYVKM